MADLMTTQSYQDELYNPHLTTQQSQNTSMQYTNSFQHQMFNQNTPQPQGGQHPWFEEM